MIIDVRRDGIVANPHGFKPQGKIIGIAVHHSVTNIREDRFHEPDRDALDSLSPKGLVPALEIQALREQVYMGASMRASTTIEEEKKHIAQIDAYHVSIGYGGFGYHAAAFPSGRAYLCGDGQRAHVKDRNHELMGICAIGDFSTALPGEAQMNALRELIAAYGGSSLPTRGHNEWALPGQGTVCAGRLNGFSWAQPTPPPLPPMPTEEAFKQAYVWLGARFMTKTLKELDPWDVGVIQSVLDRWRAERGVK